MIVKDSTATVIHHTWVNQEYKHLIVKTDIETAAQPGQFFMLLCPQTERDKPFFRRPMSTYFADSKTGKVEFLYKVTGIGTRTLANLPIGRTIKLLGPLGKGFNLPKHAQHVLIVARGVGLATLAPLVDMAANQNTHITAILSARNKESLLSQERFTNHYTDIITVTDDDNYSDLDNIQQLITKRHVSHRFDALFTCGSNRLTKLLQQFSLSHDIPGEVAIEQPMPCGIGLCYCCVKPLQIANCNELHNKRICVDGPVIDIREFTE